MPDQSPITRPPLPDRVGRLGELASDIWWVWNPSARTCFPGAGLRVVAELGAQPGPAAAAGAGGAAGAGVARPDLPEPLRPGDQGARPRPQRRGQLVDAAQRPRPDARHRLLLGRVRAAPVAADLRRRPRRAGRRPLQGSERPRACRSSASASCIRRATSTSASRPTAGRRSATSAWAGTTRRSSRRSRPTASRASSPCRSASARCSSRCGTSGWATSGLPARHRPRGERALGSRAVGAPLRRRSRDPHPAGDHPRHRRRPRRCAPLGIDPAVWHLNEGHAGFVVLQRIREFLEQGLLVRRRAGRRPPDARSSPRTRRSRPATTPSPSTMVETAPRRLLGRPRRAPRATSSRSAATTTATARSST